MKKKKKYFKEDSQNRKDLEVVFQITIDDLKQPILMKDEAIENFVMEINQYKCINLQTLPSQVQDSVENY